MADSIGNSSGAAGTPAAPTERLTRMWPAIAVGVGSGLAYGLVTRLLADATKFGAVFGVMTVSFLFLVPLVVGYLTVRPHPQPSWSYRLLAPWLPTILSVAACFAVGWEGTICIVMGLPALLIFSSVGGVIGALWRRSPSAALGVCSVTMPELCQPVRKADQAPSLARYRRPLPSGKSYT